MEGESNEERLDAEMTSLWCTVILKRGGAVEGSKKEKVCKRVPEAGLILS